MWRCFAEAPWGRGILWILVLTMWFCTPAGFFGGAITGFVLAVLGVIFLRSPPEEEHH